MNRSKLKTYAPQARRDFIRAMADRAAFYGLTKDKIEPVTVQGEVALIGGKAFSASVAAKRERLEDRVQRTGFEQTMEAMAYTWFNRLVAIRYMELHGYLDHGYRVLSHPEGKPTPEIVEHAEHVELPGLDREEVIKLKLDGTKEAELYRKLLIAQCNALHAAMPFLFERIADETELLLPDSLLHSDSLVRKLVTEIDEADWQAVEIIGWLYQFYISEKKAQVIGKVSRSEDIPAATQLFTPNWIVKYLVQNSLGRQWLATYPDSPLKAKMGFYIEPAEQTPEVQTQLKSITPDSLNPEELTLLDPACGSGHILVEAYSLLKDIYLERGYRLRDIPKLILTKNLFGLEIDDRAAQLAAFALLMIARADDRSILSSGITLNVLAIQQTDHLDTEVLLEAFSHTKVPAKAQPSSEEGGFVPPAQYDSEEAERLIVDLRALLGGFIRAKTYGSLIRISPSLVPRLPAIEAALTAILESSDLSSRVAASTATAYVRQAALLSRTYLCVAANPPYMGGKGMYGVVKAFGESNYINSRFDLFAMFLERGKEFAAPPAGIVAMVVMESWMFLSSYEDFRQDLFASNTIVAMCHMPYEGRGRTTMGIAFGTTAVVLARAPLPEYAGSYCCVRYTEIDELSVPYVFPPKNVRLTTARTADHLRVPGAPIAYWVSNGERDRYARGELVGAFADLRKGLDTGENAVFLRLWHEVASDAIDLVGQARATATWFPYNKGGDFRRWYGNREFVINWRHDGAAIKSRCTWTKKKPTLRNQQYYFRPGYTWTTVSSGGFSARYCPPGALFDNGGCTLFADQHLHVFGSLLNSVVADRYLEFLSPTLNYQPGDVGRMPYVPSAASSQVEQIAEQLVAIAKQDWDSQEESWDFHAHPLIRPEFCRTTLSDSFDVWARHCGDEHERARALEEQNNRYWIDQFELQAVLQPDVPVENVRLLRPTPRYASETLISYLIGCALGRFSLDSPGLAYACAEGRGFDWSRYVKFRPDDDGIVPLTEDAWFDDDAAALIERAVITIWSSDSRESNLLFLSKSVKSSTDEDARNQLRQYLADEFYPKHLKRYRNRPIYWLFTSGKQRAFQALVYLHRYNEGTLSRMRTEYVIPLQGKIAARIEKLEADKAKATSTSHGKAIQKEQDKLRKQQQELIAFDEKLRHYADLRIKLDLDDGVKVNYRKFADSAIGEIVAEVKAVCGKEDDE